MDDEIKNDITLTICYDLPKMYQSHVKKELSPGYYYSKRRLRDYL